MELPEDFAKTEGWNSYCTPAKAERLSHCPGSSSRPDLRRPVFYCSKATSSLFGAEELAHMEMICAIVHQLTRNLSPEEIERSGFATYYVDHTLALWPQAASGMPWTATVFQSKGDPITDLHENLAAEQKARTTYDNILRLIDDPDIIAPIRFLREREIVHYQRFGESLRIVTDHLDSKNFYAFNPEFDNPACRS
ncbi:manganese catalase family protein [Drancourtella massiliensis]|nr:manganese catalase family protein [Drancourtella massiliensis]OUN70370.1 hypothetical protein B5G11_06155 [Drancourtella sp. An57]